MRCLAALMLLWPMAVYADPFDRGEAYTQRQGPPPWMDEGDFIWLLFDYALFAVVILLLGWMLMRHPRAFSRFEAVIRRPFASLLAFASTLPMVLRELLAGITVLAVLALIVIWVFFCQWLNHHGFGALAMAGLALEAVLLVRLIKRREKRTQTADAR